MLIMIDNYDSFVYNLVRYFNELEAEVLVYRNDEITIDEIKGLNPKGIIISPGPKSPKESGICLECVREFKGKVPILGICLGHQVIAHEFGGEVKEGKEPVHGKVHFISNDGKGVFNNLPDEFKVTRYHSLEVDETTMPEELQVTARTKDGVVMGIRHKSYQIEGVQFHPEAVLTQFGHEMLQNFIKICEGE